jgi:hypothetical protein
MKTPCTFCEDRYVGCHAECFAWKVYSASVKKKREKELEAKREDISFFGYQADKAKKQYSKKMAKFVSERKRRRK